jgi:hypothetical protein
MIHHVFTNEALTLGQHRGGVTSVSAGKECYWQETGYAKFTSLFELFIFLVLNDLHSLWIINPAINQVYEWIIYVWRTYRVNEGKIPPTSSVRGAGLAQSV